MIQFSHVYKRYPNGFAALKDISFQLLRGSMTFLTGHSGAGKSTLLKLVMASECVTRGQVIVNNQNVARLKGNRTAYLRRNIGCVFQDHKLLDHLNVEENVSLPLVVSGVDYRESRRKVRAALDKVGLLSKAKSYPLALSGGEQQRVGIARAVVNRPDILLADEPTGNLDPQLADDVIQLFYQFNQINVTVLIATHDVRHLSYTSAEIYTLIQGRLVEKD